MGPLAELCEILTVLQKNRLMDSLTIVSLKETLDQLAAALHPTPLQPSLLYTELLQEGSETLPASCEGVQVPVALDMGPSGSAPRRSFLPLAFP